MASFIVTKRSSSKRSSGIPAAAAAFWLLLAPSFSPVFARTLDRVAATVNGEVILESDVSTFLSRAKSKGFRELYMGVDEKAFTSSDAALNLLVEEKLLEQQVKKLDAIAAPQDVEAQIKQVLRRNHITEAQLAQRLGQLGTAMEDYRLGIRRQLERRGIIDREIKPQLAVSEEQVKHFFQRTRLRNKPKGSEKEGQYKIADIFIAKGSDPKKAEARAKAVWDEVSKKPSEFERLAPDLSDDKSTAANGGLLGEFNLASLGPEFRRVIPNTAVDTVTAPIATADGWHIVKVLAFQGAEYAKLSRDEKEAIRNEYLGGEIERRMRSWLDRKKSEAVIRVVEPLAKRGESGA